MPKLQVRKDSRGIEVYQITVPKAVVKLKGWKKGTILEFEEIDGKVCLIEYEKKN